MPEDQLTRTCRYCSLEFPLDRFAKDNRKKPTWECRICENSRKRKWANANRIGLPESTDSDLKEQCESCRDAILARLLARRIITDSGCWEWVGAKRGNKRPAYGKIEIAVPGKQPLQASTHRLSATLFGIIDPTSEALTLHRCDNPPCFNPDHLFSGDYSDNANDAAIKGRLNPPKGSTHHWAKLQESDAIKIKKRLACGELATVISKDFPMISAEAIYEIKQGKNWKHL